MSKIHISLLRKGPKFTPTTNGNFLSAKSDLKQFTRKLAIRERFWDSEYNDESLVRNKSRKIITPRNQELTNILTEIENLEPNLVNTTHNLSQPERNALKELKNNQDIVFKKADKGGSIVIMDTDYYRDHLVIKGHLSNDTYQKVDKNADKKVVKELNVHVEKFKDNLTNNEMKYLTKYDWKTSNFYVLPKVHKCKSLQEKIKNTNSDYIEHLRPDDLTARPIVGGRISPTQRLSNLIEQLLSPIVPHLTTYVKDDWHFLRTLPHQLDFHNTTLYSVDISSLYTSIPHELGLEAIEYWIQKHKNLIPPRFTKEFILHSIKFILTHNNFDFDGQLYNQAEGTAMGTIMAPPYACLTIGYLEEVKLFPVVLPIYFNESICKHIKENFKRYMDDGFTSLLKTVNIELFLHCLNSLHPSINFTQEMSLLTSENDCLKQQLNFLDITVILNENNTVETDIYYKPTNSHDYLNYNSHHANHTKENIPFNLAKRIIVFVSNSVKMEQRLQDLKVYLKNCDYPDNIIDNGIFKARLQGPAPLKPSNNNNIIPLVTTNYSNIDYRPVLQKLSNIMEKTKKHEELQEVFRDCKYIIANRQPKNLLRILSNSSFQSQRKVLPKTSAMVTKCSDIRCNICRMYLQSTNEFTLATGKIWNIRTPMNCHSMNCIYFLTCNGCNGKVSYIGKTTNLRLRTNGHISSCRTGNGTDKFDKHVFNCNTPSEPFFKLYTMLTLQNEDALLTYESHFHKLGYDTMNR